MPTWRSRTWRSRTCWPEDCNAVREALAIDVGTSIPSTRMIRVLDQLTTLYGRPLAVRVDNGQELTADTFVDWCRQGGIGIHYIRPGKSAQNPFIERFNRCLSIRGPRCVSL